MGRGVPVGDVGAEEAREVGAAGALEVAGEGRGDVGGGEVEMLGEEGEEVFDEGVEGDGVGAAKALEEVVAPLHEALEGGVAVGPEEGSGVDEVAAVAGEVPDFGEAAEALHGGEVDEAGGKDLVGGVGAVDEVVGLFVADDGGAAKAFEEVDLDFLGAEGEEAVEAAANGVEVFAGESEDEVGMDVGAGVFEEPADVFFGALVVLAAGDEGGDVLVEGLDADFEL